MNDPLMKKSSTKTFDRFFKANLIKNVYFKYHLKPNHGDTMGTAYPGPNKLISKYYHAIFNFKC